jgi:hypothetical protein
MIEDAAQALLRTAGDEGATREEIEKSVQAFFAAARTSGPEPVLRAMRTLSVGVLLEDAERAGLVANVCGALVEHGFDPAPFAGPLVERVHGLLLKSAAFAETCRAENPSPAGEEDGDPAERFEAARKAVAERMPAEAGAWEALKRFWPPAIAVLSASPAIRGGARALRGPAAAIAEHHEAGHWIALMLSVLDDEPFVAIEPEKRKGILGRMSGVVDNFQLQVLLMDVFPKDGYFSARRVSQAAAAVGRRPGPQSTQEAVTGRWNLYHWKAIRPDLSLPAPSELGATDSWIWGEGTPEDIAVFEGHRVVLLGTPSYARSWSSQRMFAGLQADLKCDRTLSKDEVREWLRRMVAALPSPG